MNGPRNFARMETVLALALFGSMIGYLEPAYCEGQRIIDRGTLSDATTPTWVPAGHLNTARHSHTATLLPNGKVLVTGGANTSTILNSAELYDPATGTWSVTGSLNTARIYHTATLLQSGKVLVAGGGVAPSLPNTAEVYDPATGTWSVTGSLAAAHTGHAATLLPNGKVLIVGGTVDFSMLNNAELYDPAIGTWVRPVARRRPAMGIQRRYFQTGVFWSLAESLPLTILMASFPRRATPSCMNRFLALGRKSAPP